MSFVENRWGGGGGPRGHALHAQHQLWERRTRRYLRLNHTFTHTGYEHESGVKTVMSTFLDFNAVQDPRCFGTSSFLHFICSTTSTATTRSPHLRTQLGTAEVQARCLGFPEWYFGTQMETLFHWSGLLQEKLKFSLRRYPPYCCCPGNDGAGKDVSLWFWHSAGETVLFIWRTLILEWMATAMTDSLCKRWQVRQRHVGSCFTPSYTAPLNREEGWHYASPSAKNSSGGKCRSGDCLHLSCKCCLITGGDK